MKLHLVDLNAPLVAAWRREFQQFPEVEICCGDILEVATTAVVSPANSYGFMDGGIDRAYATFFGPAFERLVYDTITRRPEGFLPVGAADIVSTNHARVPYVILAPTMLMPEHVPASHSYRALRAALRVATRVSEIKNLYCPGLGTGVGSVEPNDAAREMAAAYADANQARD